MKDNFVFLVQYDVTVQCSTDSNDPSWWYDSTLHCRHNTHILPTNAVAWNMDPPWSCNGLHHATTGNTSTPVWLFRN